MSRTRASRSDRSMPSSSSGSFTLSSTLRHSNRTGAWKTMPYSRPSRALWAGLPLTSTLPSLGAVRSPMSRSSVLLPQPDGTMRLTNSPRPISRSIPLSAVVTACPAGPKRFSTPLTRTTGAPVPSGCIGQRPPPAQDDELTDADQPVEGDPQHRAGEDGGPQLLRTADVLVVEVDDGAAQPVPNLSMPLADDGPDDAGRRGHLERGEQV